MSATEVSGQRKRTVPRQRASIICLLATACLFLAAAILAFIAAFQRWVVFSGSRTPADLSVEDNLFDYSFPYGEWQNVETAAQLFGAGTLIQSLGVLTMAVGVLAAPGATGARTGIAAITLAVTEGVLAVVVAAFFGFNGAHALISGATGTPSQLQHAIALWWIGVVGLAALARLWWHKLTAAATACLCLLGSTFVGYFLATFLVAPMFFGSSHDTAKWTEAVVAASTAAAGIAMVFAVRDVARRGANAI